MDNKEKFKDLLKDLRTAKNLTQRELARRSGMKPSFINRIESGLRGIPNFDKLLALAHGLGLDHDETFMFIKNSLARKEETVSRRPPLKYAYPFDAEETDSLKKEIARDISTSDDLQNPTVKLIIETINDPSLTSHQRKERERTIQSFVGWLKEQKQF